MSAGTDTIIDIQTSNGGTSVNYEVTISKGTEVSISQEAYIKASNTDKDDRFSIVAIDGDTMVVGAPFESSSSPGINGDQSDDSFVVPGAVYVYIRVDNTWEQQAYIKASNPSAGSGSVQAYDHQGDLFGSAVAIFGDTLVVGAPGEQSSATTIDGDQSDDSVLNAGAVYVFTRDGTTWSQQAYIKGSLNRDAGRFGGAVALEGDNLVVGARFEDTGGTIKTGAAYVFIRNGDVWTEQQRLTSDNYDNSDVFGGSVAISGDTVAIGAIGEDSKVTGTYSSGSYDDSSTDTGAVYVFTRDGTTWTQEAYIKASNTGVDDRFGTSVSISEDTLAVGANYEDSSSDGINGDESDDTAGNSGAAYVFTRTGTSWTQQAYIKASNSDSGDNFGAYLVINGNSLVVTAYAEQSSASGIGGSQGNDATGDQSGAAYLFSRVDSSWSQYSYIKASNNGYSDRFGVSVALSVDTVVIGAAMEDSNSVGINGDSSDDSLSESGAVYVIKIP